MNEVKARKAVTSNSVDFDLEEAPLPEQKIIISPESLESLVEE